ncbi:lysophospholipid acyltransferase family protein [Brachybacterium sp. YJGR34]|uniref:lysophospholipid acyltransferase family protein n=1 Tax=Brachybacterium sp. YJGR34 TaxID=2059911 RepID=UPI001E54FCEE|nr:lysophospholipid acyltransferase family protein [Brachybacterium sp. YJGR34]
MTPKDPAASSSSSDSDARSGPQRLLKSLSARSRAEGWEKPEGELAKYRSRWRANVRFVLQRVVFRAVVNSAVTPMVDTHRRVKSIRGPFVLVANHTSHVDGPLLAMSLPWAQGRYLCTGTAADYWFDHWYRRIFVRLMLNAFPIDRGGSRKYSGTSRRLLRSGVPILVFPEGGRQQTGRMAYFKPGAAALAIGVGVPVVPAAIVGGYEAMPKGRNWPIKGRPPVLVVFGEPMVSREEESAVAFTERIQARVKDLYDEHHDEVLGGAARDEEDSA